MPDFKILRFDTLSSTQDYAIELARNGKERGEWAVVVADSQTKGRGTAGAGWYSPAGQNLYFSMILRPPEITADLAATPPPGQAAGAASSAKPAFGRRPGGGVINHAAALAVAEALSGYGLACKIKWPNDVQVGGKKICGILSTAGLDRREDNFVVCGVGLNVDTEEFPSELSERATSVKIVTGQSVDKDELLMKLLAELKARFLLLFKRGFSSEVDKYVSLMAQLGDTYTGGAGKVVGKIQGINEDGWLLVRSSNSVEAVCPGTVCRILSPEKVIYG